MVMLVLMSVVLTLVPDSVIMNALSGPSKYISLVFALLAGSVVFMPGFITFPLCGILLEKGVTYMVLSGFTTTLMMVGILTFPIERKFFGTKLTIIRNVLSFLSAVIIAIATGMLFGELVL